MDQQQRNLRRAAAEAFIESLDRLQETLYPAEEPALVPEVAEAGNSLIDLEQAIADIERCMQEKPVQE